MIGQDQFGRYWRAALLALSLVGCATGNNPGTGGSSTTTSAGGGGTGGTTGTTTTTTTDTGTTTTDTGTTTTDTSTSTWPCGQDCSKIQTAMCLVAVCNEGQFVGPIGVCTVVFADAGTTCDDGQFCTAEDACDGKGACVSNTQNTCGQTPPECSQIYCDELSQTCGAEPADDGTSCAPTDLCQVNGTCKSGACVGEAKDCSFSPLAECNAMSCDPATGACVGTADAAKNGTKCALSGDLCLVNRVCVNGTCGGGAAKDCSSLTVGCNVGECNATNGACEGKAIPAGGSCFDGIDQCHAGTCDAAGTCTAAPLDDGTPCNDNNPCTLNDACTAGVCGGAATTGCRQYVAESFETCPATWTLAGDWQCGVPATSGGPEGAHGGSKLIATQLASNYNYSQAYATCTADSPTIDLAGATTPKLSFWVWMDTESTYDAFNVKVSTNGGTSYAAVTGVTPAYTGTVSSEQAWSGRFASLGWRNFFVDMTPYAGQQIKLRFAFRSDSVGNYPGVYIDDLVIAEPSALQLAITTTSLPNATTGNPYSVTLSRSGGSQFAWSILGGTNAAWLSIDPTTGALSGTPTAANVGPVTVAVQVQELSVPGNVASKTFTLGVLASVFQEGFEGTCPNGWTLAGDWQCGAPTTSGGPTAYAGTKVLATQLAANYSSSQAYATCTADSPAIDLTAASGAGVTFRVWMDTELSSFGTLYDAFNLKVSTDGGTSYGLVSAVSPAYTGTAGGEQGWGGHLSTSGWQLFTADLSAYAGKSVRLRFAFRSDGSGNYPGVYIDDIVVGAY